MELEVDAEDSQNTSLVVAEGSGLGHSQLGKGQVPKREAPVLQEAKAEQRNPFCHGILGFQGHHSHDILFGWQQTAAFPCLPATPT